MGAGEGARGEGAEGEGTEGTTWLKESVSWVLHCLSMGDKRRNAHSTQRSTLDSHSLASLPTSPTSSDSAPSRSAPSSPGPAS